MRAADLKLLDAPFLVRHACCMSSKPSMGGGAKAAGTFTGIHLGPLNVSSISVLQNMRTAASVGSAPAPAQVLAGALKCEPCVSRSVQNFRITMSAQASAPPPYAAGFAAGPLPDGYEVQMH